MYLTYPAAFSRKPAGITVTRSLGISPISMSLPIMTATKNHIQFIDTLSQEIKIFNHYLMLLKIDLFKQYDYIHLSNSFGTHPVVQ